VWGLLKGAVVFHEYYALGELIASCGHLDLDLGPMNISNVFEKHAKNQIKKSS
jgi:hypothetical protein